MGSKRYLQSTQLDSKERRKRLDEILLAKGADGWGSLTAGPIVHGSVVNGRVNETAFIFVLGGN